MEFISNFWAAYVPVGIVLVAAVIELVADARERWMPRSSPERFDHARGNVIVFRLASPRASSASPHTGAPGGRVISMQEARRRRAHAPCKSGTQRSRA